RGLPAPAAALRLRRGVCRSRLLGRAVTVRGCGRRAGGRLARLLLAAPAPAFARLLLRRRQVLGERERDLLHRAELLARLVEQLRRARRVPLGRCEQRRADLLRLLERGAHELCRVLLVPMPARVRERAEEPLRLGILARGATVLHLPRRACEPPRPAREDLIRSVRLALCDRAQQHADAGQALLLPGRRLRDERDEVVEVGAIDAHRHAVLILRRARRQELLERPLRRTTLGELLHERRALVESDLASGDGRPVALLV